MSIILALGSNVGDRAHWLALAQEMLADLGVKTVAASAIMETPALLPENAPEAWSMDFMNQVLRVETALTPFMLLEVCKRVEAALGRKDRGHWGPREIDLDVIAYENQVIDTPGLQVPHPEMHRRAFVLQPMAEVAPDWRHPVLGQTVTELRDALPCCN